MLDLRPVGYIIGLLVAILGLTMLLPLLADIAEGRGHWPAFAESALITTLVGGLIALSCRNGVGRGLTIQQTFLVTSGVWAVLPIFGALPFMLGATEARLVDAVFEAMSGLTTTGSTVLSGLDTLPKGLLLWRGLMQWLGGIGIIVVAMVFLPELRIGGMQIFRAEAFDTMGKILPRASAIASQIAVIYVGLTLICALAYMATGMNAFDATVHAMTTLATGGFANYDASFAVFSGAAEYVASGFILLSALPFVRYVQMLNGQMDAPWRDPQVRAFLGTVAVIVTLSALALAFMKGAPGEVAIRQALFNVSSIISGTGYASADYMQWGSFLVAALFFVGLIGGCAGSTSCSIKIFRYQILLSAIRVQLKRIYTPNGIFPLMYDGRPVGEDVINSVMAFFIFFVLTMGVVAVILGLTGLDFVTSVSGAATAVANVGPGLGEIIGPAGNFAPLNDTAKWVLAAAMLIGRLEVLSVYVIFTINFWRA